MNVPALGIAVRAPTIKLNKAVLKRLIQAHKEKRTKKWIVLPQGYEFWRMPAPRAVGNYFVVIVYEKAVLGYALVDKVVIQSKPKLRGWMVVQSYLLPEVRGIGIMNRLYNLIVSQGRLIASPVMTQAAMRMWINRIQIDQRHVYMLYDAAQTFVHVDSKLIGMMKHSVWDGSPKTILICMMPNDPAIKRLRILG